MVKRRIQKSDIELYKMPILIMYIFIFQSDFRKNLKKISDALD